MKLELRENMYVRTKDGIIAKVDYIDNNTIFFDKELYRTYGDSIDFLEKDNLERIVKASYNIIDILEVGDYVNGYKVTGIGGTYHGRKDIAIYCDYQENEKTGKWIMIYDDEIKSVITHEQMEQMVYKVGD